MGGGAAGPDLSRGRAKLHLVSTSAGADGGNPSNTWQGPARTPDLVVGLRAWPGHVRVSPPVRKPLGTGHPQLLRVTGANPQTVRASGFALQNRGRGASPPRPPRHETSDKDAPKRMVIPPPVTPSVDPVYRILSLARGLVGPITGLRPVFSAFLNHSRARTVPSFPLETQSYRDFFFGPGREVHFSSIKSTELS